MKAAGICVFYHCLLRSKDRLIPEDYAIALIIDQMNSLVESGLADAASAIYGCVNGPQSDCDAVANLMPNKTVMISHGPDSRTEIPTLNVIRDWIHQHQDWYVLYHHTKGVSTPNQADGWRKRMQHHCVDNWRQCVEALDMGYECAGCHWLTPELNRGVIHSPFFGGNYWWSKASYLMRLPPLPEPTWANRYEAETWIGKASIRPRVVDMSPGWPTPN